MRQPTEDELRAVDAQLREAGYDNVTRRAIERRDDRYYAKCDQFNEDLDYKNTPVLTDNYNVIKRDLWAAAKEVLHGRQRQVFNWWIHNPGITFEDIAKSMKISDSSAREYLHRAFRKIQKYPWFGIYQVLYEVFVVEAHKKGKKVHCSLSGNTPSRVGINRRAVNE